MPGIGAAPVEILLPRSLEPRVHDDSIVAVVTPGNQPTTAATHQPQ